MLSKLFNFYSRKEAGKTDSTQEWKSNLDDFQADPSLPSLDSDKIRVLVFRESERRSEKSLLYDSDAIILSEPMPESSSSAKPAECGLGSPTPKYKCLKPSSDVKVLGEMIFGSVAMVYKGSAQKVHLIRTPPQLLLTKVFALRSRSAGVNFCDNEMSLSTSFASPLNINSVVSNLSNHMRSYSTPISQSSMGKKSNIERSTWSLASTNSHNSSSGGFSMSVSPCGSLRRRYTRSRMTTLDSTDIWRTKSELSEENRLTYKQQPKIAVGIIFKLWEDDEEKNRLFQNFFFTHYAIFSSHLQTLRVKIEKSFYLRQKFMDVVISAVDCFKRDILALCYSPRIIEPVWLNLMVLTEQKHNDMVERFISLFMNLVDKCESKQNNYFISTLLTAALTHHPSWVATVMPSGNCAKRSYLDKHTSDNIDILARCHPYNPLWAQLCDIYGAVNSPLKLTRIILVGEDANLIRELLYLLTYFIRCGGIKESKVQIEVEKANVYRNSGTSWNETICDESGTPNSVSSWIDKVSCVDAHSLSRNNVLHDNGKKQSKMDSIYSHSLLSNEMVSQKIFTQHDSTMSNLCVCRCGHVDGKGGNKLHNILEGTHRKRLNLKIGDTEKNSNTNSKSCKGCRTIEKIMFENYCDKCKSIINDFNLQINSECDRSVRHLNMKHNVHTNSHPSTNLHQRNNSTASMINCRTSDCTSGTLVGDSCYSACPNGFQKHKIETSCSMKNSSFQCYCCSQGQIQVNNTILVITEDHESDEEFESRERKASDPVDCIVGPNMEKCLLQHSTTSHDSGTEMGCSVTSSCTELDSGDLLNLTSDNSVSSRDNLFNNDTIVGDMDSDYCSVDNDQVSGACCDSEWDNLVNTVCKSLSSTTIKEGCTELSSGFMNDMEEFESDCSSIKSKLESELDFMNLKELPLHRTIQTPVKQACKDSSDGPDLSTFGSSLIAGYCDSYVSDFVLHGTKKLNREKLATDLQNSVKYSVLDEQVYDASCIVADTDNWTCEVWNLGRRQNSFDHNTCETLSTDSVIASSLISLMVYSTKELWDMKMPAKFCLLHLEEQLKDIYNRSKVLSGYAFANSDEDTTSFIKSLSYSEKDVELLKAVSASYAPQYEDYLP